MHGDHTLKKQTVKQKPIVYQHQFYLPGAALHGLSVQDLHRPSSSGVNLVVHHVF